MEYRTNQALEREKIMDIMNPLRHKKIKTERAIEGIIVELHLILDKINVLKENIKMRENMARDGKKNPYNIEGKLTQRQEAVVEKRKELFELETRQINLETAVEMLKDRIERLEKIIKPLMKAKNDIEHCMDMDRVHDYSTGSPQILVV